MKDFFKIRTTTQLSEEHGAGEQGTPSLVAKYKNATPGQGGSAPAGQQPARKGDKLNAKFEPVKESAAQEKDIDPNKKIVVKGVKGMKSTPFIKKFRNMAAYDKWSDSDEAGNYEVMQVMNESPEEQIDELSKKTLGSYVNKATSSMRGVAASAQMAGSLDRDHPLRKKYQDRALKRVAGVEKAVDRLTKEAVEESLDEGYSEQDAMYRKEAVKHAERVMKAVGSQYMSGCKYHARALQDMADEMENTIEYRKKDEANMKAMRAAQTKVGY